MVLGGFYFQQTQAVIVSGYGARPPLGEGKLRLPISRHVQVVPADRVRVTKQAEEGVEPQVFVRRGFICRTKLAVGTSVEDHRQRVLKVRQLDDEIYPRLLLFRP